MAGYFEGPLSLSEALDLGVQDLKIVTNKNVHKNIKEKKTYTSGPVAPLSSV